MLDYRRIVIGITFVFSSYQNIILQKEKELDETTRLLTSVRIHLVYIVTPKLMS